jgi:hypothetical protein
MEMCLPKEDVNSQLLEPFSSIVFTQARPQFPHTGHDLGEINSW